MPLPRRAYIPAVMSPKVRFAPSPTGNIHIGNARTALLNYLFAKQHGGRFVLRYDDTDIERSRKEYADNIAEDLDWLGVKVDEVARQSERVALYDSAAKALEARGLLYPCYETPDELDRRRKRQQALGRPPIYDRAALKLTADERASLEAQGRRPHWRFRLAPDVVRWADLVRGDSHIDCASLSDPVLRREDGTFLYTLPSVVDDFDLAITHIVRGEDHVTNTAVQIQIFRALGAEPPLFGHHNLLTDAGGEGLSKRTGALSLRSLREKGVEALAVAALSVQVGAAGSVHPVSSLEELAGELDLARLSQSASRFDEAELVALSARTLHAAPYPAMAGRLEALGVAGAEAEPFWLAVRGNLARLDEAAGWWDIVFGDIAASHEDAGFLAQAAAALPPEPWGPQTWGAWTAALKQATGLKGRALFHPLRLALTGRESGPELAALLPLIGRNRVSSRLGAPSS